jgi:hypothetical protein
MSFLGVCYTALVGAINHVVFLRSFSQMIWIKARWIVTLVKDNAFLFSRNSQPEFSSETMNSKLFISDCHHPVAFRILGFCPIPTSSFLVYFRVFNAYFHELDATAKRSQVQLNVNSSSGSITPSALTLNWSVTR